MRRPGRARLVCGISARAGVSVLCAIAVAIPAVGCQERTGALSPAYETRFADEGIARRADDQVFRFTRNPGTRREIREDRLASVVVTRKSLLIHKNEKVGLEITPRSRRFYAVERERNRVRVRSGEGRNEEVWSFEPQDDPAGWVADIRAVIRGSASEANR
jgi:hypothetical protein